MPRCWSCSGTLVILGGLPVLVFVYLPMMLLAASVGMWLFYVQHQFEDTSWDGNGAWSVQEAALHGSSHYVLPPVLRWITANIGVHHVHHLASRIPFYRLPEVLRDHPALSGVHRIGLRESLGCARLRALVRTGPQARVLSGGAAPVDIDRTGPNMTFPTSGEDSL